MAFLDLLQLVLVIFVAQILKSFDLFTIILEKSLIQVQIENFTPENVPPQNFAPETPELAQS